MLTPHQVENWIRPWLNPTLARYTLQIEPIKSGYEAFIRRDDWSISLTLAPDLPERIAEMGLRLSDRVGRDLPPAAALCAMLYLHEVGHWRYAPFDSSGHERILTGVTRGLLKTGESFSAEEIHEIVNIFKDILVNVANARMDSDPGVRDIYLEGRILAYKYGLKRISEPDPVTKVFRGLEYRLLEIEDPELWTLLRIDGDPIAAENIEILLKVFRPDGEFFLDIEEWEFQAKKLAKVLGPLILEMNRSRKKCGLSACSASGFTGRLKKDPKYRQEVIQHALARGVSPDEILFAPLEEVMQVVYRDRAEAIELKSCPEPPAISHIIHTGVKRITDAHAFRSSDIKWTASRWYPNSGWQWYRKVQPVKPVRRASQPQGLIPDLLFVLDSSKSMTWTKGKENGEYDLALTAFFGIRRFLEQSGIGYYLRYAVVNFSAITVAGGWYRHEEIDPMMSKLLGYQGGGTVLDPGVMRDLICRASGSFWTILLTDGEIDNLQPVAEVLEEVMDSGNKVTLIQFGGRTQFSEKLRAVGAEIHYVTDSSNLVGLVLGQAKTIWGAP